MTENTHTTGMPGYTGNLKNTVEEAKDGIADKAKNLAQSATDAIDGKRDAAASSLASAASAIHEHARDLPGGETVANLAHGTAEKLDATASYVRRHDSKQMMADVEQFVKTHPGQSLLAIAAVGFLAGRAFRGND